jgi:hypothetical protein
VIAFNKNVVRIRFVKSSQRVRHFGMEEIDFLKDFAHPMENGAKEGLIFPADKPDEVPN